MPLELHFQIFTHSSARDILHFLCTCRALYSFKQNETIWRNLSSRDFGIHDLSIFKDYHDDPDILTFHTVYTRFLHAYGPLIGLWASDHPFRGNILEFRFLTQDEYPGLGIVGEVWRFPIVPLAQDNMDPAVREKPQLPAYYETVYILLKRDPLEVKATSASNYVPATMFPWAELDKADEHDELLVSNEKPSFHQLGETTQSYFVWYGSGPMDHAYSLHPEFPHAGTSTPWYDRSRLRPRLPSGTLLPKLYNNKRTMPRFTNVISLCGAPSEEGLVKPPALSLSAGPYAPGDLHHPSMYGIADLRRGISELSSAEESVFGMRASGQPCGRYYPLCFPPVPPYEPELPLPISISTGDTWSGESLTGLWLGSYGRFSTEVLFVEWIHEEQTVKAWKITGDVEVPRGVPSWWFQVNTRARIQQLTEDAARIMGDISVFTRTYRGTGTVSGRGYVCVFIVSVFNPETPVLTSSPGTMHLDLACKAKETYVLPSSATMIFVYGGVSRSTVRVVCATDRVMSTKK